MQYNAPYDPNTNTTPHDETLHYVNSDGVIDGSCIPAEAVELPQREIVNTIKKAGLTPDNTDLTQLYQSIQIVAGATPTGAVVGGMWETPPTGYLECNGAEISRTQYASLFEVLGERFGAGDGATTFNIPDLRGEFLRGWDNRRGVDEGRELGSAQADAFKKHTHGYIKAVRRYIGDGTANPNNTADPATAISDEAGEANETRPRNVAIMFCIKY